MHGVACAQRFLLSEVSRVSDQPLGDFDDRQLVDERRELAPGINAEPASTSAVSQISSARSEPSSSITSFSNEEVST